MLGVSILVVESVTVEEYSRYIKINVAMWSVIEHTMRKKFNVCANNYYGECPQHLLWGLHVRKKLTHRVPGANR